MKFLHRGTGTADLSDSEAEEASAETAEQAGKAYTPAKGRPTPKRRDAQSRNRGPVAPPPRTQREAYKRSRGNKDDRRKAASERRERMAAGDDRYLLPRDKGPVRAYVRDIVDSRRHFIGLFMPVAILILVALFLRNPVLSQYVSSAVVVVLLVMVVEAIFIGRNVVKRVRVKFPDAPDKTLSLCWYAGVRASQIRKVRMPKPRVQPGGDPERPQSIKKNSR